MSGQSQFDRLSLWLHGQLRSVERVEGEQSSAEDLVSTAEYEIARLRRELGDVSLEPGQGVALLAQVDGFALSLRDEDALGISGAKDEEQASAGAKPVDRNGLAARLRAIDSDAA